MDCGEGDTTIHPWAGEGEGGGRKGKCAVTAMWISQRTLRKGKEARHRAVSQPLCKDNLKTASWKQQRVVGARNETKHKTNTQKTEGT